MAAGLVLDVAKRVADDPALENSDDDGTHDGGAARSAAVPDIGVPAVAMPLVAFGRAGRGVVV